MKDVSVFSTEQMSAVLAALPDPAFILTRSGRYAAIFGGTDQRYYHDGSTLVGKMLTEMLHAEKAAWFLQEIDHALTTHTLHVVEYSLASSDIRGLDSSGPDYKICFEGRIKALDFQVDGEDAVLWVASNITERSELSSQLRQLSETDSLSGLYNRRKLMSVLQEHYDLFVRYRTPSALLIFDIDHFKRINDEYGHLSGDTAIQVTASACRGELRNTDIPARLGGDEFVVLMPHTSREQAAPIAERLRIAIAAQLRALGTIGDGATISGGLSEILPGDCSSEEVLKRADEALYQAKREGRNQIVVRRS